MRRLRFSHQMQLRLAPATLARHPQEWLRVRRHFLGVVELVRRLVDAAAGLALGPDEGVRGGRL